MNKAEITRELERGGLKITPQYVGYILRGKRRFGVNKAKMAGDILKVDPAIFLLGSLKDIQNALNYNRRGE